jgi:hypothetical protein
MDGAWWVTGKARVFSGVDRVKGRAGTGDKTTVWSILGPKGQLE